MKANIAKAEYDFEIPKNATKWVLEAILYHELQRELDRAAGMTPEVPWVDLSWLRQCRIVDAIQPLRELTLDGEKDAAQDSRTADRFKRFDSAYLVHTFKVDWGCFSEEALVDSFREWIALNRPLHRFQASADKARRGGRRRGETPAKEQLEDLAIYRLGRSHHSHKQIKELLRWATATRLTAVRVSQIKASLGRRLMMIQGFPDLTWLALNDCKRKLEYLKERLNGAPPSNEICEILDDLRKNPIALYSLPKKLEAILPRIPRT